MCSFPSSCRFCLAICLVLIAVSASSRGDEPAAPAQPKATPRDEPGLAPRPAGRVVGGHDPHTFAPPPGRPSFGPGYPGEPGNAPRRPPPASDRRPGDPRRPPPPPGGGGFPAFDGPGSGPPQPPEHVDPEMQAFIQSDFELERSSFELAEKVRKATVERRGELRKQLEELLARHFDVRQQRRQLQIKRMEEELKRLQDAVDKRYDARDSLVRKRLAELLGEQEELGF